MNKKVVTAFCIAILLVWAATLMQHAYNLGYEEGVSICMPLPTAKEQGEAG